ncbi:MAG TPA: flagellar hook-basal body complex protein FliE [Balneolaceae bacterium]|nr:flagellar hook-basal body complex protein FliE [Balneolaceae bacterium]
MPIQNISPVISHLKMKVGNEGMDNPEPIGESNKKNQTSFGDMVANAVNSVDHAQKTADKNVENIITGKSDNVHGAMISMEKAKLSFELMLHMRNKAVNTFQELSRMPI